MHSFSVTLLPNSSGARAHLLTLYHTWPNNQVLPVEIQLLTELF